MIHGTAWVNCKSITLSERHQTQETQTWFHLHEILEKAKLRWLKADQWLPGSKAGNEGTVCVCVCVCVGGVMDLFCILIVVAFTQLQTLVKIPLTGRFKLVTSFCR